MCGIFALINPPDCPVDLHACRVSTDMMEHRGPDAYGEWVSESRDVFLGHRRLSIIDLSAASAQPMTGDSGRVLNYNGEIFNFRALRSELRARGCAFRSSGDTEVLLQSLETFGAECLARLEGMFAFVLWDPANEEAMLARDPFGIKPLYICRTPTGGLAVSSEIKAFYAQPDFAPRLDCQKLPEYLRFRALSGGATLLQGVAQVKPGHVLRYCRKSGEISHLPYWYPLAAAGKQSLPVDMHTARDEFLRDFKGTVERHLIADVPVGLQFSGGVDSSLIMAVAARDLKTPLVGFHCEVSAPSFNEAPQAERASRIFSTPLHKVLLTQEVFFSDLLEKSAWHSDEPLAHPNSLGIYMVSALAHGRVKALVSGESADEFFAGYSRYPLFLLQERLRKSSSLTAGADLVLRWLGLSSGRTTSIAKALKGTRDGRTDTHIVAGMSFMDAGHVSSLLADTQAAEKSLEARWALFDGTRGTDVLTRCQIFDIQTYLPALFLRQDKMSMAASIENRVPYAAPGVFYFAMNLPPHSRATLVSRKGFLKSCLAEYCPKKYTYRRKNGFGIPITRWFRGPEGGKRLGSLTDAGSALADVIDMKAARGLLANFSGTREQADIAWTLLSLKLWMDIFLNPSKVLDFGRKGIAKHFPGSLRATATTT